MPKKSSNTQLNPEQLEAIHHGEGPLMIVAGAGTGKTTVITERIKYLLLEKHINPSEILALTFTDKAAREMEERVDVALPYGYSQLWIATFHGFCERVLRQEAIHIGLTPKFTMMSEAQSILFARKNIFKFELDYFRPIGNPNKFLEGMLTHFSRLKDEDITPEQYCSYAETLEKQEHIDKEEVKKTKELAFAYKTYEELKAKEGVMDFSDLISNTLLLFRTRSNVLKEYQDRFKFVLLDEFQDTNFAQNELAVLLAGKRKNITVVGDDDQAIYRWRGAAVSNIMQFRSHFPNTKIIVLTKNYRSTQTILDTSYKVIQHNNPDRLEIQEKVNKHLTSMRRTKGVDVDFIYKDRVENEADAVAIRIQDEVKKGRSYKDFAILVRANNHADPFIRAFERYKIPVQFLGPGQLFKQNEIRDLISYLKVLYNYEDSIALYRVLSMPIFKINPRDIASLLNLARKQNRSLFETLEQSDQTFVDQDSQEKITKLVEMIHSHMKAMQTETAGQILYLFLQESGMLKEYMTVETPAEEKRANNIAKFFDKIKTFEVENEDASVPTVVEWIDLSMSMGESPAAANTDWAAENAVNILTIHSSKGLEFPVVFVVNVVSQRFPSRERREQIPLPEALIKEILPEGDFHLQEERRLFYVAMTRAKDELILTAANYYGEGKRDRKLSPFIYEALGEEAVDKFKPLPEKTQGQLTFLDFMPSFELKPEDIPPLIKPENPQTPITYLSYTQIDTFKMCPLHYKARYILKLPTPQNASLSFGSSIHNVLRDFYQQLILGKKPDEINIEDLLKRNWINEGFQSRDHEEYSYKRAQQVLHLYTSRPIDLTNLPIALEFPFQFRIKKPNNTFLRIGGKIDRIDKLEDGKIEILDYKTGSNVPEEKELKRNLQMNVYALAATEVQDPILNKTPEEISLSLYYIEPDKKLTIGIDPKQLTKTKEDLLKIAEEIEHSDFNCNGNPLCENCEFKMLCGVSR